MKSLILIMILLLVFYGVLSVYMGFCTDDNAYFLANSLQPIPLLCIIILYAEKNKHYWIDILASLYLIFSITEYYDEIASRNTIMQISDPLKVIIGLCYLSYKYFIYLLKNK